MYARRQVQKEQQVQNETPDNDATSGESITHSETTNDLPIALRKGTRAAVNKPIQRYGFENDISNYVSY